MPTYQELIALAQERAAMEVDTWIPEKKGDRIAGIVIELGTITTKYGDYYTSTLETFDDYVENGETKLPEKGKFIRVAWMGAVLKAQFERMRPVPQDVVAFHYQDDVSPQNGMNDYALIVAAVIDQRTGQSKVPVDLNITVPTTEQIVNADPRTGEIARATVEPFTEANETLSVKGKPPVADSQVTNQQTAAEKKS